jgi:hypothetical protein
LASKNLGSGHQSANLDFDLTSTLTRLPIPLERDRQLKFRLTMPEAPAFPAE